jgi:hypothetical protein
MYDNNKPELHKKEYFVGLVTVSDRADASMIKRIVCQLHIISLVRHMYHHDYDNGSNTKVGKYYVKGKYWILN